mgnify:CR=1 FL=1
MCSSDLDRSVVESHLEACGACADLVTWAAADLQNRRRSAGRERRPFIGLLDPLADVWVILDLWSEVHYGPRQAREEDEISTHDVLLMRKQVPKVELPPSTEEYAVCAAASIASSRPGRSSRHS